MPTGWRKSNVTVTLTATDTGGSGVDKTYYTIGSNPPEPTTASAVYDPANKPVLTNGQRIRYFSVDGAGNAEQPKLSEAAAVDLIPPTTSIDSGPSGTITETGATFAFSSNESGSSFECRLNGEPFTSCTSPRSYGNLPARAYTFQVRSTDQAGNVDPNPASRAFSVQAAGPPPDTTPPQSKITSKLPTKVAAGKKLKISFRASEQSTFRCRLDRRSWRACVSPTVLKLKPGRHRFQVAATDTAGNTDPTPAKVKLRAVRRR